ncbi:hypothetical protein CYMTET_5174 [Cymbomonas tetramitiformis]|uniref:Uncharacterized protein n=1 Tax=Cymbomonas tetramitiformis TaxID=36881 RepID=A0AAE0GZZ9_9CHLO|nr:hypothetical protein CYMTET_5174 [Cymbomonas tetramitiformis]
MDSVSAGAGTVARDGIEANRKANPYAPFNPGLVAVDGVKTRADFSLTKSLNGGYSCKVFGHQHCFQGTYELNEEIPTEAAFARFESKIYIGLTPDMIRFLKEMQNTIDQMQKGRSNIDLMKGLRSTLSEKHGVLYTIYREALISEFEAAGDVEVDAPGQWRKDGLVAKMAEFQSVHHGFTHPDVTKYPEGFVYIEETAGEGEEEAEEQTARVLDLETIDTHLSLVESWWPIMSHLDQAMLTYAKEQAFSKHSVTSSDVINAYFMHWSVALFRRQTWDLCEEIMGIYMKFELKGMKNPLASKSKKRKSASEAGPSKKKGKKATSSRQPEDEVVRGGTSGSGTGGLASQGGGILAEEAQFIHNAKNMGMAFWDNMSGLAGNAEFDKVDSYLRKIIERHKSLKEGGDMISKFKKERLDEPEEEIVTMKPRWKIVKNTFEDLTAIPRLLLTGAVVDGNYALDKEKDAQRDDEGQNDFLEVIDKYCSGRAERFCWHKQGVHMNPNKSMFKRNGKVVNNHQKPQALLMELIQIHMLGENPGKSKLDENDRPLNWILDACCGVGSTSMAALRCGMNVIGFDHDAFMVMDITSG